MWTDVDFGAPVQMDRVELHGSLDEQDIDVKLEGVNASMQKLGKPALG